MPFTRPGPSQPPPCPPMQSRIPVRMGPNPRGHRPIMSYSRPDPPPQQPPFRYTMVPGMPRGLRPGYYIDPNESDPFSRMYNAQDLMDVEQQEEEIRQEQMRNPPPPRMVPGEGATGFTNLTGTDPSLPYGEQWSSSAWDEEAYAAPRQYLGNPFLSEPQIQEDNLGNETCDNSYYDLMGRDWDTHERSWRR